MITIKLRARITAFAGLVCLLTILSCAGEVLNPSRGLTMNEYDTVTSSAYLAGISGTITDAYTGLPVSGAEVSTLGWDNCYAATTAADGSYRLVVRAGTDDFYSTRVRAISPDYNIVRTEDSVELDKDEDTELDMQLVRRPDVEIEEVYAAGPGWNSGTIYAGYDSTAGIPFLVKLVSGDMLIRKFNAFNETDSFTDAFTPKNSANSEYLEAYALQGGITYYAARDEIWIFSYTDRTVIFQYSAGSSGDTPAAAEISLNGGSYYPYIRGIAIRNYEGNQSLWMADDDGLIKFTNPASSTDIGAAPGNLTESSSYSYEGIKDITFDSDGMLWVTTDSFAIVKIDPERLAAGENCEMAMVPLGMGSCPSFPYTSNNYKNGIAFGGPDGGSKIFWLTFINDYGTEYVYKLRITGD